MKKSNILEQATDQAYQAAFITGDLAMAHRIKTAGNVLIRACAAWEDCDELRKADNEGEPTMKPDQMEAWVNQIGGRVIDKLVERLEFSIKELEELDTTPLERIGFNPELHSDILETLRFEVKRWNLLQYVNLSGSELPQDTREVETTDGETIRELKLDKMEEHIKERRERLYG